MYKLVSKLIVYRNIGRDSLLFRLADLFHEFDTGEYVAEDLSGRILDLVHELLDLATVYGFDENLWHNYLAYLLAMTENPFTLVSEKTGAVDGSVNQFVQNDFSVFYQLMKFDFAPMEKALGLSCFSTIQNYRSVRKKDHSYNRNVSVRIQELSRSIVCAKDEASFYHAVIDFYERYGVGQFGMNKAFRISPYQNEGLLAPIVSTSNVTLDDLFSYDQQKEELKKNTEAFLTGQPANNVLLFGDAGTGKSTSIKALLNMYYPQGLRMIEIYKHEFHYLPEIISIIKGRNYKFIIYMDDLSFESAETEYKYLKAVIEGDLEIRPDNVLIYATSNRRHLIRETFSDRKEIDEDDIHRTDTMAERLSLSHRFGVTIGYYKPGRQEFFHIVCELAKKNEKILLSKEELLHKADLWQMRHGTMSGRLAQQFIDYLSAEIS